MNEKQTQLLRNFRRKLEMQDEYLNGYRDAHEANGNDEGFDEATGCKWAVTKLLTVLGPQSAGRRLTTIQNTLTLWRSIFQNDERWDPKVVTYRQSWAGSIGELLEKLEGAEN